MAWGCQATSHNPSQSWSRSLSTYCITKLQWVKSLVLIWFHLWVRNLQTSLRDLTTWQRTGIVAPNRPVAQIPQCTNPISHNVPLCNRNVHVCTFLLQNGALWDSCLMFCGNCEMAPMADGRVSQHPPLNPAGHQCAILILNLYSECWRLNKHGCSWQTIFSVSFFRENSGTCTLIQMLLKFFLKWESNW